jgi:hypothetical protein
MRNQSMFCLCCIVLLVAPVVYPAGGFTVGRTTHYGNDGATSMEDNVRGTYVVYTGGVTAIVKNMSTYIRVDGWSHKLRLAIYNSDSTHYAGSRVGMTEERNISGGLQGWELFNFSYPYPQLHPGCSYQLCIWGNSSVGDCFVYDLMATTGDEFDIVCSLNYTGVYPSVLSGESLYENRIDIYCSCVSLFTKEDCIYLG